jgi:hypothetical protein
VSDDRGVWLPASMSRHEWAALGQRLNQTAADVILATDGTTDPHLALARQLLLIAQQQLVAYLRAALDVEP